MKELLITNLVNIGLAGGLLALAYISNICFSLWYNIKGLRQAFDKTKFINGLLKLLAVIGGLGCLAIVVTFLPIFINYIGIAIDQTLIDYFNIIAILGLFIGTIIKYSTEGFDTLKKILNATTDPKSEDQEKNPVGFVDSEITDKNEIEE